MTSLEIFVLNVRNLMEQRGLKLTQVAEQVGVTKSYLSLILSNTRKNLSDELKDKLAAVLGTTVADLYTLAEPGLVAPVRVPQLTYNKTPRQKVLEQIDSVAYITQANENFVPALCRGIAAMSDEETAVLIKVFDTTLDYLKTRQMPGRWQAEPAHFQAFGLGQIKDRLTFEARVVLSYLAVIRSSCEKDMLVKILPSGIVEQVDNHLEELWKANLINLQYSEHTIYITTTVEEILNMALTWLTATARRNIHYRVAREMAAKEQDDYLVLKRIADHYSAAGDTVEARHYLVGAQQKAFAAGDYAHAAVILHNLAKLAQGTGDKSFKAYIAHQKGLTEFYLDNYEEALTSFKAALAYYRQSQEQYSLTEVHNAIGATYLAIYEHSSAKKHLQRGLQNLSVDVGTILKAKLLVNLGTLYGRLNDWQKAEEYYKLAVSFAAETGDVFVRAYASIGLGIVARFYQDWQASIGMFNDALNLLEEGSPLVPQVLTNLGITYRMAGDTDQAFTVLQEAQEKIRLTRDLRCEAKIYLELSTLYLDQRDVSLAAEFAQKAHQPVGKSKSPKDMGHLCYILGQIALSTGDLARAREMFSQGLGFMNQINAEDELQDIFYALAQVCEGEGDFKNAQFYARSAEKLKTKNRR